MKRLLLVPIAVSTLALAGCNKHPVASKLATPSELAPALNKAFDSAKPELKSSANSISDSIQSKDFNKVYVESLALGDSKDLNFEQRQTAAQVNASALQELVKAAAQGDARANEFLKAYRQTR
jgi:outer membrane murein-binding lipoprotein Lpp